MTTQQIIDIIKKQRFPLEDEKILQKHIGVVLTGYNIPHEKEYRLSDESIVDFFIDRRIAFEVKIKGSKREIFNQCYRYSEFPEVEELILFTNVMLGKPALYQDKPFHIINLSMAWL